MKYEIERKYLINNKLDFQQYKYLKIVQGYIHNSNSTTVRIRTKNNLGFITIKGESDINGLKRMEWEKEIPIKEAKSLLHLCNGYIIEKKRYLVTFKRHLFEVDVFEGCNKGLILAEIELEYEDEFFEKPSWLVKEVTGVKKYYNSYLSKNPYKMWK